MKTILHTPIRELLHHQSIQTLLFELYLMRNWPLNALGDGTRLFSALQGVYEPAPGKSSKRFILQCAVPGGLLRTKLDKIKCPTLNSALCELALIKAMPLEMYTNKPVLTFLNDYFCKRPRPLPARWF